MSRHSVETIAGVWFVFGLGTVLWVWGLNPLVFQVTDEAVVRQAARLVRQSGSPALQLPFPDPEDLAHMRSWISMGDRALPTYAPVGLYGFGMLLRLHQLGTLLIQALPAAGLAAFAAATARLLPPDRRWLGLAAPTLGFVSLYWVLHPWLLLSPVITALCLAFFFWTSWKEEGGTPWLAATTLCVGAGAAIRPDYAGFLLLSTLLLLLADNLRAWKAILVWTVLAGVCALVPNLVLNKLTTGHALRAVYQIALDRQYGESGAHGLESAHGFAGLATLQVLLMPMGFPALSVLKREFVKYFLTMGIVPVLLVGQLALIPLWRRKATRAQALYVAALLLAAFFVVTHLHNDLFGGSEPRGFVHHSAPRYLSPVFLFAALPPLLFLGHCRRDRVFLLGVGLVCSMAAKSVYDVYLGEPSALAAVHRWIEVKKGLLDALDAKIPKGAMVYSIIWDKVFWSRWRVGVIEDAERTATSMNRAVDAGLEVFVVELKVAQLHPLLSALHARHLALVRVDGHRGLYHLDRRP